MSRSELSYSALDNFPISRREFGLWTLFTLATSAVQISDKDRFQLSIERIRKDIKNAQYALFEGEYSVIPSEVPLSPSLLAGVKNVNDPFLWAFGREAQERCLQEFIKQEIRVLRLNMDYWRQPVEPEVGSFDQQVINSQRRFCSKVLDQGMTIIISPICGWRLRKCLQGNPVYGPLPAALHPLTKKFGYEALFTTEKGFQALKTSILQIIRSLASLDSQRIFFDLGNELLPPTSGGKSNRDLFNSRLAEIVEFCLTQDNQLQFLPGVEDPTLIDTTILNRLKGVTAHLYPFGTDPRVIWSLYNNKDKNYPYPTIIEEMGTPARLFHRIHLPQDWLACQFLLYCFANTAKLDHSSRTIQLCANSIINWKYEDGVHDDGFGFVFDKNRYPLTMEVLERIDDIYWQADRLKHHCFKRS